MLDRPHSPSRAELRRLRDQRYRARRDACRCCYTIEGDAELLDTLVKLHWIEERALTDKKAVEAAITAMLKSVRT